jgi:hypothetical protein
VYRVWIGTRKTMTATVRADEDVDITLWRPTSSSIYELGKESARFRAAESARAGRTDSISFRNTAARGAYYFLELHTGRRAGGRAAYSLAVTTK